MLAAHQRHPVRLRVIGNKVTGPAEVAYRQGELGEMLLGYVTHSSWVSTTERSDPLF